MTRIVRMVLVFTLLLVLAACGSSFIVGITWGDRDSSTRLGRFYGEGNALVYEDSLIRAEFSPILDSAINFTLHNRSTKTARIIWDEAVFINVDGSTSRVMHAGVRYIDRNSSQPPTTVPAGSKVDELILPTDHVYYVSGQYGGWRTSPIVPAGNAPLYDGKTVSVFLPMDFGGERVEYRFNFKIVVRER